MTPPRSSSPTDAPTLIGAMLRRDVLLRGLKFAVVVGTILVLINHWDALLAGDVDLTRFSKIALTYCVPFVVTVLSSAQALAASKQDKQ